MANRIPVDRDLALSFWARLTIIEQFSLAIVDRSFPQPFQGRSRPRRRDLKAIQDGRKDHVLAEPAQSADQRAARSGSFK